MGDYDAGAKLFGDGDGALDALAIRGRPKGHIERKGRVEGGDGQSIV
jgi:hypothetical protein